MRRPYPGQSAAARSPERAALMLGRMATATGGGSSEYMIFEHAGAMYRSQWDETTGERVWTRWPTGEIVPCPMGEVA